MPIPPVTLENAVDLLACMAHPVRLAVLARLHRQGPAHVSALKEELGVDVALPALRWQGVVHRLSDTNRIDFFYEADVWSGTPTVCEPHKCGGLSWYDLGALPDGVVPYVKTVLLSPLPEPWMMELGWQGLGSISKT